jgi:hypothetical protein
VAEPVVLRGGGDDLSGLRLSRLLKESPSL